MVKCPECSKAVDADFGMTTCPHCEAVFMVEIDGSVNEPEVAPVNDEIVFADISEDLINEDVVQQDQQEEPHRDLEPEFPETSLESSIDESESFAVADENNLNSQDNIESDEEMFALDESNEDGDVSDDALADPLKDPLDLQRFDESGGSELSGGELLYDIIVEGLDSSDLKKDIFAALMDKRFALSADELRRGLKSGILTLSSVNPVRAMLIVLKLQEYDVTVEWRQRHFAQPSRKTEEPSP